MMKGKSRQGLLLLVSVLAVLLLLSGCAKSEEAQRVDDMIAAIGNVTLDSEAAIAEAEAAAGLLSEKDRSRMDNLELLQAARTSYNELLICGVEEKITEIGTPSAAQEDLVTAAKAAYMALPAELQSAVSNYGELEAAEDAIFREKLTTVEEAITAIGEVSLSSEAQIGSARALYDQAPAEIQEKVSNYSQLTAAEERFFTLSVAHIQDAINSIGEVTPDSEAAIAAARAAYGKASSEVREQVNNYDLLLAAEETFNELRADEFRNLVNAIGVVDVGDKELIDSAYAVYQGMNTWQTNLVTEEYSTLVAAEKEYYVVLKEDLLSDMYTEEDEMMGTVWYFPDAMPEYINDRSYVLPYIGKQGLTNTMWLRFAYVGDDWVFFEKVTIKVDNEYYNKTFSYFDITRDNAHGDVWEYIDHRVTSVDIDMLWDIVNSGKTIVRFEGDEYHYDITISEEDKEAIEDMLLLYELFNR